MPRLPRLPIGLAAFDVMRRGEFVYVDKTADIYRMVDEGIYYFLSRPRRFGKSLLVSTLRSFFQGQRDLFEGLWIATAPWDWTPHPIILLDFNNITHDTPEHLKIAIQDELHAIAAQHNITLTAALLEGQFRELIVALHRVTGRPVVILIDEYDKPIIDHLGTGPTGMQIAQANRAILKRFFGVLKSGAVTSLLRFVLLTGISRFSKVSVFSELNNLNDLTMHPAYAAMLGYTQAELEQYFAPHLQRLAHTQHLSRTEVLTRLKYTYDGYRFSSHDITVYNPFSTLKALETCVFGHYWFETGTPTFLIELLQEKHYALPQLERFQAHEQLFSSYRLEDLQPEALLLQTGYVTIKDVHGPRYTLGYPNLEVKMAFVTHLFFSFAGPRKQQVDNLVAQLPAALAQEDFTAFGETIQAIFAHIPYPLAAHQDEAHFHALFYLMVMAAGLPAAPELLTNRGRIDLVIELATQVFVIEFKCNQSPHVALQQIQKQGYAERYRLQNKRIFLLGFNFSTALRNVKNWDTLGPLGSVNTPSNN